jgi:hypothetical protein
MVLAIALCMAALFAIGLSIAAWPGPQAPPGASWRLRYTR